MVSTKSKIDTKRRLEDYQGQNPYLLWLKKETCVNGRMEVLDNEFVIEYVKTNYDTVPRTINRIAKLADWYGEAKKKDWGLDFIPDRIKVITYLGETKTTYHCLIQYRQSVPPRMEFLSKKGVITNFLVDDYHAYPVDFDKFDAISTAKDPNRKLMQHQKEGVQFLLSRKRCVIADGMGCGKTTTLSVAAIEGNFEAVVIICPASVKTTWKKELMWYVPEDEITIIDSLYGKKKSELEVFLGYEEGKSGKNLKDLQEEAKENGKWKENHFVILNYDIITDFYQLPESRKKEDLQKAEDNSPLLKFIKGKKSCIIIDESHRLSNMTSGWSKNMKSLVKKGNPECVFLSTGTPITNDPQNFFNMLNIIEDDITDDWVYYMKRYCSAIEVPKDKAERDRWSTQFCYSKGKSNWFTLTKEEKEECAEFVRRHCKMMWIAKEPAYLDELKERTKHIYIRREKEDLNNVVQKTIHEYLYDLSDEQMKEYKRLWKEYETEKLIEDPMKELNKALLEGAVYRSYLSQAMVPHTIELANKFIQEGEKVVIACCFDAELYALKEHYGDMCVIFNGKLNMKQKEEAKRKFFEDPRVRVFIGNIQAAGVGIDLTVANKLIFNDFSFVPADNDQMCDRIHRLNQTKDCEIYYQIFRNTQYERMFNTVIKKSVTINTVIKKEGEK